MRSELLKLGDISAHSTEALPSLRVALPEKELRRVYASVVQITRYRELETPKKPGASGSGVPMQARLVIGYGASDSYHAEVRRSIREGLGLAEAAPCRIETGKTAPKDKETSPGSDSTICPVCGSARGSVLMKYVHHPPPVSRNGVVYYSLERYHEIRILFCPLCTELACCVPNCPERGLFTVKPFAGPMHGVPGLDALPVADRFAYFLCRDHALIQARFIRKVFAKYAGHRPPKRISVLSKKQASDIFDRGIDIPSNQCFIYPSPSPIHQGIGAGHTLIHDILPAPWVYRFETNEYQAILKHA